MELFHLTAEDEWVIEAIAEVGLIPSPNGWDYWGRSLDLAAVLLGNVVWFIDDPAIKQWEGLLDTGGSSPLWRVVCDIPTQDPNLIRFLDCVTVTEPDRFTDHTWVYAGVVPPSRIKTIEFLGSSQSNLGPFGPVR